MAAILRVSFQVGKIDGRLSGLETAVADLRQDNANLRQEMSGIRQEMNDLRQDNVSIRQEMNGIHRELAHLREQIAEIRGMLRAVHERIDLVMRHRHDETGAVVLTPTEPAPVAD